jgi:hypothetical protein
MTRTPKQRARRAALADAAAGHDTGTINWPKGTPPHLLVPACPTCPRCQELVPTGAHHDCPRRQSAGGRPEAGR